MSPDKKPYRVLAIGISPTAHSSISSYVCVLWKEPPTPLFPVTFVALTAKYVSTKNLWNRSSSKQSKGNYVKTCITDIYDKWSPLLFRREDCLHILTSLIYLCSVWPRDEHTNIWSLFSAKVRHLNMWYSFKVFGYLRNVIDRMCQHADHNNCKLKRVVWMSF